MTWCITGALHGALPVRDLLMHINVSCTCTLPDGRDDILQYMLHYFVHYILQEVVRLTAETTRLGCEVEAARKEAAHAKAEKEEDKGRSEALQRDHVCRRADAYCACACACAFACACACARVSSHRAGAATRGAGRPPQRDGGVAPEGQ